MTWNPLLSFDDNTTTYDHTIRAHQSHVVRKIRGLPVATKKIPKKTWKVEAMKGSIGTNPSAELMESNPSPVEPNPSPLESNPKESN